MSNRPKSAKFAQNTKKVWAVKFGGQDDVIWPKWWKIFGNLFQNDENDQKWSKLGQNNQKSHVDLIRRQMDLKIGKITFEYTKLYSTYFS